MKKFFTLIWLFALPLSAGFDFSVADSLFAERENNPSKITEARAIYRRALNEAKGDDLVRAMDYLGKLAYYEGDLLTAENNHDKRVQIFQQCQDDVEKISPQKLGKEVDAYY